MQFDDSSSTFFCFSDEAKKKNIVLKLESNKPGIFLFFVNSCTIRRWGEPHTGGDRGNETDQRGCSISGGLASGAGKLVPSRGSRTWAGPLPAVEAQSSEPGIIRGLFGGCSFELIYKADSARSLGDAALSAGFGWTPWSRHTVPASDFCYRDYPDDLCSPLDSIHCRSHWHCTIIKTQLRSECSTLNERSTLRAARICIENSLSECNECVRKYIPLSTYKRCFSLHKALENYLSNIDWPRGCSFQLGDPSRVHPAWV